jgi:YHS domain-containing protein
MDIDPVCGMTVSRNDVSGESEYQDKPYYFCSPACKELFDSEPARYALQQRLGDGTDGS